VLQVMAFYGNTGGVKTLVAVECLAAIEEVL
jgi:hypothetical protein